MHILNDKPIAAPHGDHSLGGESAKVTCSSNLSAKEQAHITRQVILHDRAAIGAAEPRPVSYAARRGGQLLGGVCGHLEIDRLYVQYLWVHPSIRGQGLGPRLLLTLEAVAVREGCTSAQIESLAARSCTLYLKQGYQLIAQVDDYIPGLHLYILRKPLGSGLSHL